MSSKKSDVAHTRIVCSCSCNVNQHIALTCLFLDLATQETLNLHKKMVLSEVFSFFKFHHSFDVMLLTCCVAFKRVSTSCFLCIGVSCALSDCTLGTCHFFALVLFLSFVQLGIGMTFMLERFVWRLVAEAKRF